MKISILIFGFVVLLISCCKDYDNALPAETQEGKNTFGCLVDGHVWLNKGQPHFGSPNLGALIYTNEFRIIASRTGDNVNQYVDCNYYRRSF